jgi:hypothetical protein
MSTKNLPGGKTRPARKADDLTAICEPRRLTPLWTSTACYRDSFTNADDGVDDTLWAWLLTQQISHEQYQILESDALLPGRNVTDFSMQDVA